MTAILLIVLLAACSDPDQRADPPPRQEPYDYGDFRRVVEPAQPTVPPPGTAESAPKKDCDALCDTWSELNEQCASWTKSCARMIAAKLGTNNDTCSERKFACGRADKAKTTTEGCICR